MSEIKKDVSPTLNRSFSHQHGDVEDISSSDQNQGLHELGYEAELTRNRSMLTLLFQSLAIAAIPYGFGGPLISAIYGGGQLPMFVGWIFVLIVDEAIAISLGELASKYPTSAGPYYWSFQVSSVRYRKFVSYINGWIWLIGNWTITLSVNFGFASLLAATVALYYPDYSWDPWKLLLIFWALCIMTFFIVAFGNRFLPSVDTFCAAFTLLTIFITLICLSVKADVGRHPASYTLGHFDTSLSGWGGFSFLIGTLPSAYTFSALGMISAMAEECGDPTRKLPTALALCVPVGGIAGFFFIVPICATLPALSDILEAPIGQALPYIYLKVMGSPSGAIGLMVLVLLIVLFCSISITVAASRTTWAFARDKAIPLHHVFSKVSKRHGTPIWALVLTTVVEMCLGLIYLGSSSAFNAFVSVGVFALAISYGIPIFFSMLGNRRSIRGANWLMPSVLGWTLNIIAVTWIVFELILFSMPTTLPTTPTSMNYAIVVFIGFLVMAVAWYWIQGRKLYTGPPVSEGLAHK